MNRSRGYDSLMNSTFFVAFASALLTNLFLHYIVDLNVNWFFEYTCFYLLLSSFLFCYQVYIRHVFHKRPKKINETAGLSLWRSRLFFTYDTAFLF